MQVSLNEFYHKNKKRATLKDKKAKNKDNIIVTDNKLIEDITKEKAEDRLRAFDLDPKYGPCKGISRTIRYQNAVRLNLSPPSDVKKLIDKYHLNTSYYDTYI